MKKGYLTPELKQYYLTELEKCINCNHVDWKLDSGLSKILPQINSNTHLVTMISKFGKGILSKIGTQPTESYLQLCFTEQIEESLYNFLNSIKDKMESARCIIEINKKPYTTFEVVPKHRQRGSFKGIENLDIVTNVEKYTSVNRVWIFASAPEKKTHVRFWELLTGLKDLK